MNEDTIIKPVRDLPYGQDFVWYGDANVLGLSSRLTCPLDVQRAIDDALVFWRRNNIRIVGGLDTESAETLTTISIV